MGKCAALPQNFLILQETSPGLARSEGKEHTSKLMGWQRQGTAHRRGGEGLVLAAGRGDAREIICTGEGAGQEEDRCGSRPTPPGDEQGKATRDLPAAGKGRAGHFKDFSCPSAGT